MKEKFSLILLVLVLTSCNNKKEQRALNDKCEFVYSRGDVGAGSVFSLKFSNNDTLFFRNYKYNPNQQVVYALMKAVETDSLINLLSRIHWSDFDSTYMQKGLEDGSGYKFYFRSGKIQKWVYIYGKEGPKQLYRLASWVEELKAQKNQHFQPINKTVNFGDIRYIRYPELLIPKPK